MKLQLTLDVFSGRPNPTLTLEGREATDFLRRAEPAGKLSARKEELPFRLGYRGIIVEQLDEPAAGFPALFTLTPERIYSEELTAEASDKGAESFLLDRLSGFRNTRGLGRGFRDFLRDDMVARRKEFETIGHRVFDPPILEMLQPCSCAPLYEPAWWNVPIIQPRNNCYNYATNYRSDSYAQPGRAAGAMYTNYTSCVVPAGQRSVRDGAVADCLIDTPNANNVCPKDGHLVALVIAPGPAFKDFHWYRKGKNGRWSHKPGGGAVTHLDNSGAVITDPRTANRGYYTQFCTFMKVMHGHIKIN